MSALYVGIEHQGRTLWIALAEHVWATKDTVVHAVDSAHVLAWTKGRRKTWDAECGARATPYLVPVRGEENTVATPVWPPRVSDLQPVGLSRCVACHKATGRKRPATSIMREAA